MRKNRTHFIRFVALFAIGIFLLSGCVSQKKVRYLQNKEKSEMEADAVLQQHKLEDYKLQPGDNLYIKTSSLDERSNAMFNTGKFYQATQSDVSVYLESYQVNAMGYIEFPVVGKLHVQNRTLDETKVQLQEAISEYIKDATVNVKLVNFNVTILGEVSRPGQYKVYQNHINIFQALAMAGDLTSFAHRQKVKVVRNLAGKSKIEMLDLTDRNLLSSDYYHLMPGDIVYIEPIRGKNFAFQTFPYALIFSSISTALLLINFFQ